MIYRITLTETGQHCGHWHGTSPADALAAMHRNAGHADVRVGPFGTIIWPDEDTLAVCGDVEDWTITEDHPDTIHHRS